MKNSIFVKSIAFFLAVICFVAALASGIGILVLANEGLYTVTPDTLLDERIENRSFQVARNIALDYAARQLGNCPEALAQYLLGAYEYSYAYGVYIRTMNPFIPSVEQT